MPRVSVEKTVKQDLPKKRSTKPTSKVKVNSTPKKITQKKSSLIDLKPKTKKNVASKKRIVGEVVNIPSDIDHDLIKKVRVYEEIIRKRSPKIMANVASVTGYTFIITGLYLCFLITDTNKNYNYNLLSSTICSTSECLSATDISTTTTDTSPTLEPISVPLPVVNFSSDFPKEVTSDFVIKVDGINISSIRLFATGSFGENIELTLKNKESDSYFFLVPYELLKPDTYQFRVKVQSLNDNQYYFSGPSFLVIKDTSSHIVASDTSLDTTSTTSTASTTAEVTDTVTTKTDLVKTEPFIRVEKLSEINKFKFTVSNTKDGRFVEIYALPTLSGTPFFLGLAIKKDNIWVFPFDGNTLPAGDYGVYGKTVIDGKSVKTTPIKIFISEKDIKTTTVDSAEDNKTEPIILTEKVKRLLEDPGSETEVVPLIEQRSSYFDKDDVSEPGNSSTTTDKTLEFFAQKEALDLINSDNVKLNKLLQQFASAIQGNDENLQRLAIDEINKYRDSLILKAKINIQTKDISEQITLIINAEFEKLIDKVKKFETLLRERTELIGKDSDGDGITDFDEVNLYRTNANDPDTDHDGVIDGIEITKGYDPNNSNSEAVISFHSPKDVNYVDDKNMKIDSVTPVIETDQNQGGVPLKAEIKGKGLPNSFVTLFIYSTPTIVSVKTDENGDFVYTFTKELEDGQHEVYVAITDNEGAIVARSNPFQFIKTAEAFTPIDSENSSVAPLVNNCTGTGDCNNTLISSYNIAAAMGVVSFGLILLMLGQTLRGKREDDLIPHDSDS
jgi:hypothetical protein